MTSVAAAQPGRRSTLLGIGLYMIGALVLTVMDAIGKHLSADYAVQQISWGRFLFHGAVMLLFVPRVGAGGLLRTAHLRTHILRGCLVALATICLFTSLSLAPIADVYTVFFTAPLMTTMLSAPLLGERVGWRRWAAVVVGFAGVLIVIRPGLGPNGANWALALTLVTAIAVSYYQITTRRVAADPRESPLAMLFYIALVGTFWLSLVVPFYWVAIAPRDWAALAVMGALGAAGHLLIIRALMLAPASVIAPFMYTQLAWALLIGFLVFGDLPDAWMLLGGTIIVASGLYTLYREARRRT